MSENESVVQRSLPILMPTNNDQQAQQTADPFNLCYRIAKFEKVSFDVFKESYRATFELFKKLEQGMDINDSSVMVDYDEAELEAEARIIYDEIKLPKRATVGSAGYDFFFPYETTEVPSTGTIVIPTGIKVSMAPGWVLLELPRSSYGFKYRVQLDNTVGVIDQDYYGNPSNEGHIMMKLTTDSKDGSSCVFTKGEAFCQGVFVPFGLTVDDDTTETRTGGIGSTTDTIQPVPRDDEEAQIEGDNVQ